VAGQKQVRFADAVVHQTIFQGLEFKEYVRELCLGVSTLVLHFHLTRPRGCSRASIMASATPLCFCVMQKHLTIKNKKAFKDVGRYSEWPKVADAVIEARTPLSAAKMPRGGMMTAPPFKICAQRADRPGGGEVWDTHGVHARHA
jgi:hypothetical protein